MTSLHLSDDQFTRYLMDPDADGAEAAHLLGCTVCREELERFRSSVESFNSMTLAWSERHSITSPSYAASRGSAEWVFGWSWSVAVMMLLAVGTSLHLRKEANQANPAIQASDSYDQNSEAEIARDNQLMRAVNLEINRKEPFPLIADNVPSQRYGQGVKKRLEVRSE